MNNKATGQAPKAPILGSWSKGRLRKSLMLGHIFTYLAAVVLTLVGLGIQLSLETQRNESDRVRAMAELVGNNIPKADYAELVGKVEEIHTKGFTGTEKQQAINDLVASDAYKNVIKKFTEAQHANHIIKKIILVRKTKQQALVVASLDQNDIASTIHYPGKDGMKEGFSALSSGDTPPIDSEDKLGMTGYAPVHGKEDLIAITKEKRNICDLIVALGWLWLLPLGVGLGLSFLMALRMAGKVMEPLKKTAEVIQRMSEGDMDAHISPHDQQVTRVLRRSVMDLGSSLGKRERVRNYYGRTLAPELMESVVIAGEEKLTKIEKRAVSLMRVNIETDQSLNLAKDPEAYFEVINAAAQLAIGAIFDNNGSVEDVDSRKVIGVFGSPLAMTDHVGAAIKAAAEIRKDLAAVVSRRKREGLPGFSVTVWVHTGEAVVGIVGTSDRGEYRAVGGPVDDISDLQRPEKTEGCGPLASEAVINAGLPQGFNSRFVGESGAIKLYQILA